MSDALLTTLKRHFGYDNFRPGQLDAIESVLAGHDTLVVMPTGSGKSLIYQLAALQLPGITLVVSPLIALMKDQVDQLTHRHIASTFVNSSVPSEEQTRRLDALIKGDFRIVYVAPERLRSLPFLNALRRLRVALLAVDEAHCLSQWGHDFRPDYLHIPEAHTVMGRPVMAALTATAPPRVQEDIVAYLNMGKPRQVVTGFNRANLGFQVRYTADYEAKLDALQDLLKDRKDGGCIVYVGTRHEAEELCDFLSGDLQLKAQRYHGGLPADQRAEIQDDFMKGVLPIIVATNAFGMGIDRPDVRLVVHFNVPGTLEAYYQEAGRAGRDGHPAQAVLLYSPRDRALQEWFVRAESLGRDDLWKLYSEIESADGAAGWTTIEELSRRSGFHEVKAKCGLAELERLGIIVRAGDAGARMMVDPADWREDAVREAVARIKDRQGYRLELLDRMIEYAETDRCRRRLILDYFSDSGPADALNCCDNCLARVTPAARQDGVPDVSALSHGERAALIVLDTVRRLKWGVGRTKLAQILFGSRAQDVTQSGYDRHIYYGRLSAMRRRDIDDLIRQLIGRGYLKTIGAEKPVVRLTPKGESAVRDRAPIRLTLPPSLQPATLIRRQAQKSAGGTVELTAQLLMQGLSIEAIAGRRGLHVSTIYTHLAQLIEEGSVELSAVLDPETIDRIRAVLPQSGPLPALSVMKALLPPGITYEQIRCVLADRSDPSKGGDAVRKFLQRLHPRALAGSWRAGWSLGFHSRFDGRDWGRSPVGELVFRFKYQGDTAALTALLDQAIGLCSEKRELVDVDGITPIPPSSQREQDPVSALAAGLGERLSLPVLTVLVKTRQTAPQKEMQTLAQKRANVAGSFAVQGRIRGRRLLLMDDLFDSGCTLEEATRTLLAAGARSVCVLALTRTIHSDA